MKPTGRKRIQKAITAKTSGEMFSAALRRRQAVKKITHLYDHSLPSHLRFTGLFEQTRKTGGRPIIRVSAQQSLSPFVIHLRELPSPQQLMAEQESRHIALNFLVPSMPIASLENWTAVSTNDLGLHPHEIVGQLVEDFPRVTTPNPSLKRRGNAVFPITKEVNVAVRAFPAFPIHELAPKAPPADILAYFDLPETEAAMEDEADVVRLDELQASVEDQPEKRKESNGWFWLPRGSQRAMAAFVLLSLVFVLPLHAMNLVGELRDAKASAMSSGALALGELEQASASVLVRDASGASQSFNRAGKLFADAQQTVTDLGTGTSLVLSALPLTQKHYRTNKNLAVAGEAIAQAGERIADGFVALERSLDASPTSRLMLLATYVEAAVPNLERAEVLIASIDEEAIPAEQRTTFLDLKTTLTTLSASLREFLEFSDMAQTILGADGTKRYLAIFQNNTELRPTGGFMGSFAEVTVRDGEIVAMHVPGGGTYDLQGQLRENLVAPEPLRLLSARWEFQDANWFPDFPTSARQMLDFYQASGGPTVDGVIAVNATYVADLLALLGPVEMPEYNRTVTTENFVFEAQKIVELEYDRTENKPKAFIGDLAPKLLDRVREKTGEDFLSLADFLNRGLSERDIQLYFANGSLERRVRELGWGGELKATDGDYLMVVDTNLGGGKTDGVIEQDVDVTVHIDEDGIITNTVTVKRSHYGIQNALFTGVNNVDYLRLYVPKGSTLIDATGFSIPDETLFEQPEAEWLTDDDLLFASQTEETDQASGTQMWEESGKTVFGNWVQTKPGTTSQAVFTYRLPFTITAVNQPRRWLEKVKAFAGFPQTDRYTMTVQKQSGVIDRETRVHLELPESLAVVWSSADPDGVAFTNATDAFFALLLEPAQDL